MRGRLRKDDNPRMCVSMHDDRSDEADHRRAIESLAEQARVPVAEVARLYEEKRAALGMGARITGFLAILTVRNVREALRRRRRLPASGSGTGAVDREST